MDAKTQYTAEDFLKDIQKIEEQHNVKIEQRLLFPDYLRLPADLQLAILIIEKHNPQISFIVEQKDNANKK